MKTDSTHTENPLVSVEAAIAFSPHDWSAHHRLAWIYGITCGWDDSLEEVATKFRWSEETVARLERLHSRWENRKDE